MITSNRDTDLLAAQCAYRAAVCLEATVFALMAIHRELEVHLEISGGRADQTVSVLISLIDPVNELEVKVAKEFERLTGRGHPVLNPY